MNHLRSTNEISNKYLTDLVDIIKKHKLKGSIGKELKDFLKKLAEAALTHMPEILKDGAELLKAELAK